MFEDLTFIAWNGLIGGLLPLVISFLKQQTWTKEVKRFVAAAISLGAAVISAGAELQWETLELAKIMEAGVIIFPIAQATYLKLWKGTKVDQKLSNSLQVTKKPSDYQGP